MYLIKQLAQCDTVPLRNDRGTATLLATSRIGAELADVRLVRLDPQGPPAPYHTHHHSENVYWILSGQAQLRVEGAERIVRANDVVFIAPGTPHALSADRQEVSFLEIFAPAGDDFAVVE